MICKKTLEPVWNLFCEFWVPVFEDLEPEDEEDEVMSFKIWDWDKGKGDDFLGRYVYIFEFWFGRQII